MYRKLPDYIKSLVIKQWLEGVQRDKIAANNGLSAGAVTNVVNEWRRGLGATVIDDLRELGVTFRKAGITPAQCALGFRTTMLISKLASYCFLYWPSIGRKYAASGLNLFM